MPLLTDIVKIMHIIGWIFGLGINIIILGRTYTWRWWSGDWTSCCRSRWRRSAWLYSNTPLHCTSGRKGRSGRCRGGRRTHSQSCYCRHISSTTWPAGVPGSKLNTWERLVVLPSRYYRSGSGMAWEVDMLRKKYVMQLHRWDCGEKQQNIIYIVIHSMIPIIWIQYDILWYM